MIDFVNDLGWLAIAEAQVGDVDCSGLQPEDALTIYSGMLKIRLVEEAIGDLAASGDVNTPVHLAIGQEAVSVGVSYSLRRSDRIYSNHRGHGHFLALGGDLDGLFAEIFGKDNGVCGGMGGSMHLRDASVGFHGSVPIVGGSIPIAVGAALASKLDESGTVAVAYFGDGACEEGVLHESLNLASVLHLPIIFVCENNLYSSHMDIDLRQPSNKVSRFAEAHRIPSMVVDGNNVIDVINASNEVISNARDGFGPSFLEAITFRWRGHVGPNIDYDVGVLRSPKLIDLWKKRDPVARFQNSLVSALNVDLEDLIAIENNLKLSIQNAVNLAKASDYPSVDVLLDYVYSKDTV